MASGTKVALALVTLLVGVLVTYYGFLMDRPAPDGAETGAEVGAPADDVAAPDGAARADGDTARRDDPAAAVPPRRTANERGADGPGSSAPLDDLLDERTVAPPRGNGATSASAGADAATPPVAGDDEPGTGLALVAAIPENQMAPPVVAQLPDGASGDAAGGTPPVVGGLARTDLAGAPSDVVANGRRATRDVPPAGASRDARGGDGDPDRPAGRDPDRGGVRGPGTPSSVAGALANRAGGTWTIRSGDTLSEIAKAVYGRASAWRLIVEANPGLEPTRLRVGKEIRLPNAAAASSGRTASSSAGSSPRTPPGPRRPVEHVVRAGETLSEIAQRHYGSAGYWERIYRANRRAIGSDPDALQVGTTLVIPVVD